MGNGFRLPRLKEQSATKAPFTGNIVDPTARSKSIKAEGAAFNQAAKAAVSLAKWYDRAEKAKASTQLDELKDEIDIASTNIIHGLQESNIDGTKWGSKYRDSMDALPEKYVDAFSDDGRFDSLNQRAAEAAVKDRMAHQLANVHAGGMDRFNKVMKEKTAQSKAALSISAFSNPTEWKTTLNSDVPDLLAKLISNGVVQSDSRALQETTIEVRQSVADHAGEGFIAMAHKGQYDYYANEKEINELTTYMSDRGRKDYIKKLLGASADYSDEQWKMRERAHKVTERKKKEFQLKNTAKLVAEYQEYALTGNIAGLIKTRQAIAKAAVVGRVSVAQQDRAYQKANHIMDEQFEHKILRMIHTDKTPTEMRDAIMEGLHPSKSGYAPIVSIDRANDLLQKIENLEKKGASGIGYSTFLRTGKNELRLLSGVNTEAPDFFSKMGMFGDDSPTKQRYQRAQQAESMYENMMINSDFKDPAVRRAILEKVKNTHYSDSKSQLFALTTSKGKSLHNVEAISDARADAKASFKVNKNIDQYDKALRTILRAEQLLHLHELEEAEKASIPSAEVASLLNSLPSASAPFQSQDTVIPFRPSGDN